MDRKPQVSEPYIWQPLARDEVVRLMQGFSAPWWFAGGQAIDAFLGYESREHGDIDIACFREDHLAMQRHLASLELWCADQPYGLRPWEFGETLGVHIHDIWGRKSPDDPWCLQLMLDERDGDDWVYRRHPAIRRSIETLLSWRDGVPFLAVEVQLLYKSPRSMVVPKNLKDFETCLPLLDQVQRQWLAATLQAVDPGHDWSARLELVSSDCGT